MRRLPTGPRLRKQCLITQDKERRPRGWWCCCSRARSSRPIRPLGYPQRHSARQLGNASRWRDTYLSRTDDDLKQVLVFQHCEVVHSWLIHNGHVLGLVDQIDHGFVLSLKVGYKVNPRQKIGKTAQPDAVEPLACRCVSVDCGSKLIHNIEQGVAPGGDSDNVLEFSSGKTQSNEGALTTRLANRSSRQNRSGK